MLASSGCFFGVEDKVRATPSTFAYCCVVSSLQSSPTDLLLIPLDLPLPSCNPSVSYAPTGPSRSTLAIYAYVEPSCHERKKRFVPVMVSGLWLQLEFMDAKGAVRGSVNSGQG